MSNLSFLNQKGKPVWGSSVYRLEIISDSRRLSVEFKGVITLYERRHESIARHFEDLTTFIDALKEFWQTSLPNAKIQDTRLARWLEEYLTELNIRTTFNETMDAMRGKIVEVRTLEVSEERKLEADQLEMFIDKKENFINTGITKSIKGDLTDIKEIDKVLTKFLEDNKKGRSLIATSTISFKDSNNQERVMNETKSIVEPILDEHVSLWTGFSNTFSETVSEVTIVDVIPYCYKLLNSSADRKGEKTEEMINEGLKISWKFGNLDPEEKVRVDYELDHRMMRTILIRDDNDITLLNTFEEIKKEGNDIWVEASYSFREKTDILENVVILDQLPNNLQFISSTPEATEPQGKISTYSTGIEIEWTHNNVPVNTQFVVTYDLRENLRVYRDNITIQDEKENTIADVIKVVKPLKNEDGYGIIFAVHAFENMHDLIITDRVSIDFKIEAIASDSGNIEEEMDSIMKNNKWRLTDIKKGETLYAYFRYIGTKKYDLSHFNVLIPDKASIIVEQKIINKSDKLILPNTYHTQVDV